MQAAAGALTSSGSVSPSSSTMTGAFMLICSARVPSTRARSYLVMYGVVMRGFGAPISRNKTAPGAKRRRQRATHVLTAGGGCAVRVRERGAPSSGGACAASPSKMSMPPAPGSASSRSSASSSCEAGRRRGASGAQSRRSKGTTLGERCRGESALKRRRMASLTQAAEAHRAWPARGGRCVRRRSGRGAAGGAHLGLRSIVHSVVLIAAAHATARQSATARTRLRAPGGARQCGAAQRGWTAAGRPCRRLRGGAAALHRAATHPSPPSS